MRRLTLAASASLLAALAAVELARSEEPDEFSRRKPIDHPFVSSVLGRWTSTRPHGQGAGSVAMSLGVRNTALIEDWKTVGEPFSMEAHAVYKLSDDGRTLTCWWFDDESAEAMRLSGPLTNEGFDLEAKAGRSGVLHHVLRKTPAGFEFRVVVVAEGKENVRHREEWRAAAK